MGICCFDIEVNLVISIFLVILELFIIVWGIDLILMVKMGLCFLDYVVKVWCGFFFVSCNRFFNIGNLLGIVV